MHACAMNLHHKEHGNALLPVVATHLISTAVGLADSNKAAVRRKQNAWSACCQNILIASRPGPYNTMHQPSLHPDSASGKAVQAQ